MEIFRAGNHTAMNGETLSFRESDLLKTAKNYDPQKHEAPLVVGHPSTNSPAYGWVQELDVRGGILHATPTQIDPDFKDLVTAGKFKKISASFYAPSSPANPCPGTYYLRHVGFLGAQPPAVKGLKSAEFEESEEYLEFVEVNVDDRLAELERREAAIRQKELSLGFSEFLDPLIREGRILPNQKNGLISLLSNLSSRDIEFSECEGKSPLDFLKEMLSNTPKQVEFAEVARDNSLQNQNIDFAAPAGYSIDGEALEIHNKALIFQKSHGGDYLSAVKAVSLGAGNK